MGQAVVAVMAAFMVLGAFDKAFFENRLGYGEEFDKGLATMGPLTVMMVGIMCIAPVLGKSLAPVLAPFFAQLGSDPAMFSGILFGVDAGGLALARALAQHPEAPILFSVGLGSTLACTLTFSLPLQLSMAQSQDRPAIARGLVASIIACPMSILGAGLAWGVSPMVCLSMGWPAFAFALVLAVALLLWTEPVVRVFLALGRILMVIFIGLLVIVVLQHYFHVEIIAGMDPIEPQLTIVGEIGIMLSGAYPMVLFVQRHAGTALKALARLLGVDDHAALGMVISLANPLPMYALLGKMSARGRVLCSAFAAPVGFMLGDHLGFMSAAFPEGIPALLSGKTLAALAALFVAIALERLRPSRETPRD